MKKLTHIFLLLLLLFFVVLPLVVVIVPFLFIYLMYDRTLDQFQTKKVVIKKTTKNTYSVNNWAYADKKE
tara:strand:- start:6207 stop:6416 length:210 start_codon:yes stop_codon:yes gene_type:complete